MGSEDPTIHNHVTLSDYLSSCCTSFGKNSVLTCPHFVHWKTGIGMKVGLDCPVRSPEAFLIWNAWVKLVPEHSSHKTGVV